MKLFFFLIAAFFIGGSTAQSNFNISAEIANIYNTVNALTAPIVTYFANNLRDLANSGLDLSTATWNWFRSLQFVQLFPYRTFSYASPGIVLIVNNSIAIIRDSINNDAWLRNTINTFFDNARTLYTTVIQDYNLINVTNENYQCWNVSKPDILKVLRTFANNTDIQSRQPLADYNSATIGQHLVLAANITAHQALVFAQCSLAIFNYSGCIATYVSLHQVFVRKFNKSIF
jgi:hypothetical protein